MSWFSSSLQEVERPVVPKDTKYVPLVQQEYCSAPACISMVMLRRGMSLVPQELLGHAMGLTLPFDKEITSRFYNGHVGPASTIGYGVRVHEPEFHPNVAFKKLNIPLHFQFVPVSALKSEELLSFLDELTLTPIEDAKDILFCFSQRMLSPAAHLLPGGDRGVQAHVCVLDRIEPAVQGVGWRVRIIDPAAGVPKWRICDGRQLLLSMQAIGDDLMGGIWLIHRRDRRPNPAPPPTPAPAPPPQATPPPSVQTPLSTGHSSSSLTNPENTGSRHNVLKKAGSAGSMMESAEEGRRRAVEVSPARRHLSARPGAFHKETGLDAPIVDSTLQSSLQTDPPNKPLPRLPGRPSPLPSGPGGAQVTLADLGPGGRPFTELHKLLAPDGGGGHVSEGHGEWSSSGEGRSET